MILKILHFANDSGTVETLTILDAQDMDNLAQDDDYKVHDTNLISSTMIGTTLIPSTLPLGDTWIKQNV